MRYEQWIEELTKDTLSAMKKEKTITFDEIDRLTYGDLDEEEFFSIKDRESINKKNNKKTSE